MNSLKASIEGRLIVVRPEAMARDYQDLRYRVVEVISGPGCSPMTAGSGLTCRSVLTGETLQLNGQLVERFATVADLAAAGR